MIAALTILPIGSTPQLNPLIAEVLGDVRAQHVVHEVTATGTSLEGTWEEIMMVAKRAHAVARQKAPHVVTLLKIEDDEDTVDVLPAYASSAEERNSSGQRRVLPDEEEVPDVGPGAMEPQFA